MRVNRRQLLSVLASVFTVSGGCLEHPDAETAVEVVQEKQLIIHDGAFTPASIEVPRGYPILLVIENHDEQPYVLSSPVLAASLTIPSAETIRKRVKMPTETGRYEIHFEDSEGILEVKALPAHVVGGCGCAVSLTDRPDNR